MKKFKKLMIAGLTTVMAVGVMSSFAACGGGKTELVVNTMFGGGDGHEQAFNVLNSAYTTANADVKLVDRSDNPTGTTWSTDVLTSLNSKNDVPDVLFYFSGSALKGYEDKFVKVADIQNYVSGQDANGADIKPYATYGSNIVAHDTDDYSLELKGTCQALMYDTAKISEENLATVDTLLAFFKSNINSNDKLSCRRDVPHYWFNHLMCAELGVAEFSAFDGTKDYFTAAKTTTWKKAFNKVVGQMKEIGFATDNAGCTGTETQFYNGQASALIDGSWAANDYTASSVATKSATLFPGKTATTKDNDSRFIVGGFTSGWYITKQCWDNEKKRDAAVKYVMSHTSNYAVGLYCQIAGGLPANGGVVPGANAGTQAFASVVASGKPIVLPVDDRVGATAKATLLTDWSENHAYAKLLKGTTELNQANTDALFDAFIAAL